MTDPRATPATHSRVDLASCSDREITSDLGFTPLPPPTLDLEAMLEDRNREIRRLRWERAAGEWGARQQNDEMRAAHARELGVLRDELRATQERLGCKEALIAQMRDLLR